MTSSPGTIGVPCADLARHTAFTYSLSTLIQPEGTVLRMQRSANICENLNAIIRELEGDWLWVLGDDHVFEPDLLMRLLAHDVDIVVPMCWKRMAPFALVAYMEEGETVLPDGETYPLWKPLAAHELPEHGLVPIDGAGGAGMLIKRHVLEALRDPWFENSTGSYVNEDVNFCLKAREAGFKVLLDVEAQLGHIGTFEIWPHRNDETAGFLLKFGNGNQIFVSSETRQVA